MLHKDSEPTLCSRIALPGREASTNIVVRAPRRALESSPELPPSIEAPSFLFLAGVAAGLALALVFGTMSPRRGAEVRYDVCSAVATMAGLRCTE